MNDEHASFITHRSSLIFLVAIDKRPRPVYISGTMSGENPCPVRLNRSSAIAAEGGDPAAGGVIPTLRGGD
jgi:hypothetical protein